jgi:hypothetical protein
MKSCSAELAAHIAGETTTLALCCYIKRTDNVELRVTNLDENLVIADWQDGEAILNGTYLADPGYSATDVDTTSDLNVDNLDIVGVLSSPSITDDDLRAGLWDFAEYRIFLVNYEDLTQGRIAERRGWLGEVHIERGRFTAELRGLMQAFSRSIGRIDAPSCNADLGDARCGVNLVDFTETGTIEGVNPDSVTLYDSARTEPGPAEGAAIAGVSNANPCVITTEQPHTFTQGQIVTLSDIVGPTALNVVVVVRNPGESTFEIGIDTTDTVAYPAYVSGGLVTPFEATGYFDYGKITFDTGANAGLSMEVKSYVPGQITLFLPMPYEVEVGDQYTIVAGCGKQLKTDCQAKFNNVVNFRGFLYLPGVDKLVQVGRHK